MDINPIFPCLVGKFVIIVIVILNLGLVLSSLKSFTLGRHGDMFHYLGEKCLLIIISLEIAIYLFPLREPSLISW